MKDFVLLGISSAANISSLTLPLICTLLCAFGFLSWISARWLSGQSIGFTEGCRIEPHARQVASGRASSIKNINL